MAPDSANPPTSYLHPSLVVALPSFLESIFTRCGAEQEDIPSVCRFYIAEKGVFVEQEDHLSIGIHIHRVCVVEQEDHLSAIVGQAMDYLIYSCINLIEDST